MNPTTQSRSPYWDIVKGIGIIAIVLGHSCYFAVGFVYLFHLALFFFVSGHFVLSFAANILFGVLADWVASLGKYYDRKLLFVSYILFSFGLTGPILPLWFMKDAYVVALQARGKDAAYIDALFAPINTGTFIVCLVSILVCAVIGGLFGQKMIKKHFAKAGIV